MYVVGEGCKTMSDVITVLKLDMSTSLNVVYLSLPVEQWTLF